MLLFLAGLLLLVNLCVFLVDTSKILAGMSDFPIFYANARIVRDGKAADLFNPELENSYLRQVSPVVVPPFNHLPFEILIYMPIILFGFRTAFWVWTTLNVLMVIVIARLLRPYLPGGRRLLPVWLSLFAFFPIWVSLIQGQDSIVLLLIYVLFFMAWKYGYESVAGFVLAFGLFKFQLVLPFLFGALIARKWKLMRGFIPGLVIVALLSTGLVGWRTMGEYGRLLTLQGNEASTARLRDYWHIYPGVMANLRGFLWLCLPDSIPRVIRNFLLLAGSLGLIVWSGLKWRQADRGASDQFNLAFSLNVLVTVLVSFHIYLHDFSLIIFPVLFFGNVLATSGNAPSWVHYAFVTALIPIFMTPLSLILLQKDKESLLFLPVLLLGLLISREIDRSGSLTLSSELEATKSTRTA